MRRKIAILVLGLSLFIASGCASLNGKVSRSHSLDGGSFSTLTPSEKVALVTIGFDLLEDKRPKTNISYMTSIREKVSTEILSTLRSMQLFNEVHFPASKTDNIVISGEIRKFDWEYYNTMISYIPGLNVLPFFGLTSTRSRADVEVYLEFKNNKTNEVILVINESFIKNNSYNMYSFSPNNANSEVASCFAVVLNKIKDDILLNKNKILEAAKVEPAKISKPAEEVKPTEEIKPDEVKPTEEAKPAVETKPAEVIKLPEDTKPSGDLKVITPPEEQKPEVK